MLPRVSGYVLAGGESSRMQQAGLPRDKALLQFGERTLLELAVTKLRGVCADVSILGGSAERSARLGPYGRVIPDRVRLCGPLGALDAAMEDCREEWLLLMPVDLPLLPTSALKKLVKDGTDMGPAVTVFETTEHRQPLPVVIHRAAHPVIHAALHAGERKLMPVLQRAGKVLSDLGICVLPVEQIASPIDAIPWFTNVNTPEELRAAREMAFPSSETEPNESARDASE